jgi:ABC-type multidrug transport system fused ATPase/permease subunit
MRFNLDPKEICDEQEMLDLLKDAGLDELILKKKEEKSKADAEEKKKKEEEEAKAIAEGKEVKKEEKNEEKKEENKKEETLLDFEVEDGGGNLSSGEKALICICRAILRKTKIVILDEATATIDLKTEQQVQAIVNKRFKGCTMLTIAHRLQTIIDSDKVLLLGDGKKMEFGAPQDLLKDDKSLFKKLVDRMQNLGAKTGKDEKKE